jgi:hypothetical protein
MLRPQRPIDICCDHCGIMWWKAIPGNDYSVLPPTERSIMFQVHTNARPSVAMASFEGDANRLICPSQCQAPLKVWVADSGSGLVELHGCTVAISCGSGLGRIVEAAASPPAAGVLGTAAAVMTDWRQSLGTPLFKVEGSNVHALNGLYCVDTTKVTSAGSPYVRVDEAGRRILPGASFVKRGCFAPAPWELHNEHGQQYVSTCIGKVTPLDASERSRLWTLTAGRRADRIADR